MFKIIRFNCCGLDVHKTWIYACIGITDANGRTEYKESRFKSFSSCRILLYRSLHGVLRKILDPGL